MSNADKNAEKQPTVSLSQSVVVCVLLAMVALVVRGLIYFRVEDVLHAEEAIQGLMARHILGGSVQLFTYGYPYLGTLQAHLLALCFALFGSSVVVLKWAAGVESLLLVVANYLLAREVAGGERRAGLIAALLTAVGPLYLVEWSLRPRGGHLEVATFSALAFWALLRALRSAGAGEESSLGAARRWLALCAFLLGLGWWTHLTMFYAIVACAIAVVAWGGRLRGDIRAVAVALGCFLVGSLPFWLYNVKYPGRTFGWLFSMFRAGIDGAGIFGRLIETIRVSIPILLGGRQTESDLSFGVLIVLLSLLATIIAIGAAIAAVRRQPERSVAKTTDGSPASMPSREGVMLLVISSVVALVVFVVGPFFSQIKDPRALLPLYGALPPLMAIGISRLWDAGGIKHQMAVLVLIGLGVVYLSGYRRAERGDVQPRVQADPVPTNLDPLKYSLEANEINLIYTNFYIGYRLAFETGERVIACTDKDPEPERYPAYAEKVRAANRPVALVVSSRMAEWLEADLKKRGIGFSVTKVQDFRVFHNLTAPYRDYPSGPQVCVPVKIEVGQYVGRCWPEGTFFVQVTVTNQSSIAWPAPPNWRTVQLTYHLLDPKTGRMVRHENQRFSLEKALAPGESATVAMEIEAPGRVGDYAFVPDLVIEGIAWLSAFQSDLLDKPNWREFTVAGTP